jgi:Tat protein secretion system quality control protein TatD with DNase activity
MIVQVAEVVAAVRGVAVEEVAAAAYNNTMKCFFRSK